MNKHRFGLSPFEVVPEAPVWKRGRWQSLSGWNVRKKTPLSRSGCGSSSSPSTASPPRRWRCRSGCHAASVSDGSVATTSLVWQVWTTDEDQNCNRRSRRNKRRILASEFGVLRSLPGVDHLLHRLGYSYLRPRPRHRLVDPQVQEEFKIALPARLQALREAHSGQRLRIYFQDESRFGQQGTTTNLWARRGSRPTAVRQTEYQYLWVLGAVCQETGHAEGLLSPQLNTKIVNLFLEQFSRTLAADEHAAMIWDGAGFHVSKKLQVPANITLVQLPPYSPELNPIENLWHYLKSHFWSNRAYDDYDELEQAAIDAWRKAVLDPDLMKTVCAAPYANRATSD